MKTVKQGQSFLDLVVENTGTLDNAFEMALENGYSVTDKVSPEEKVKVAGKVNKAIAEVFYEKNKPASEIDPKKVKDQEPDAPSGIDYMEIQKDFIVKKPSVTTD